MANYRNTSGRAVIVGARKVYAGATISLPESEAAKYPQLTPVGGELLTEAPVGEAKPVVEETKKEGIVEKVKKKISRKKKTTKAKKK